MYLPSVLLIWFELCDSTVQQILAAHCILIYNNNLSASSIFILLLCHATWDFY